MRHLIASLLKRTAGLLGLVLACCLTFAACNKENKEKEDEASGIVGTWHVTEVVTHHEGGSIFKNLTDSYPETYYEFRADGTFSYHYKVSYPDTFTKTGTYTYNDVVGRLTYRNLNETLETTVDVVMDKKEMKWTQTQMAQGKAIYAYTTLVRK